METPKYDILSLGSNDNSGGHPGYECYQKTLKEVLAYLKLKENSSRTYYICHTGEPYMKNAVEGKKFYRENSPDSLHVIHKDEIDDLKRKITNALINLEPFEMTHEMASILILLLGRDHAEDITIHGYKLLDKN
jgi:hypothetical protein